MGFDIHVYTRERPEIDKFLTKRFGIGYEGTGRTIWTLLDKRPVRERLYVVWGDDEGDFVNLGIEDVARPAFFPRYAIESDLSLRSGLTKLPLGLVLNAVRREKERILVADEALLREVEESYPFLMDCPPEEFKRLFGVLKWARGQPVYHSTFGTTSEAGLANAVGLARILAMNYDGIIWDAVNQEFGDLDRAKIIENGSNGLNLMAVLIAADQKKVSHLRLVDPVESE